MTTSFDILNSGHGADFTFSNSNKTATSSKVTVGIAVDLDNKKLWARVGPSGWTAGGDPAANSGGNAITSVVSGNVFPAWSGFGGSGGTDVSTLNAGATDFQYAPPSGFSAWGSSCTWDSGNKGSGISLTNGSLTATATQSGNWQSVRGTTGHTSGKWYFELSVDNTIDTSHGWMGGVENGSGALTSYLGSNTNGAGYQAQQSFWLNGSATATQLPTALSTAYNTAWRTARSTGTQHTSGKWYIEASVDTYDGGNGWMFGVLNGSANLQNFCGHDNNGTAIQINKEVWKNNSGTTNFLPDALTLSHRICLAIDLDHNKIWFRTDGGTWSGTSGNPATNTGGFDIASVNDGVGVYVGFSADDNGGFNAATMYPAAADQSYTVPSGFTAWDAPVSLDFSLSSTIADFTLSAAAMNPLDFSVNVTLANFTLTASESVPTDAAFTKTLADFGFSAHLAGNGFEFYSPVADFTASATIEVIQGVLVNPTLANFTLHAHLTGEGFELDGNMDNFTVSSTMTVTGTGTAQPFTTVIN